jgi:COMPASS component SWD3
VVNGKIVHKIYAHTEIITRTLFGHDGTIFASSSFDGLTRIWDTNTGNCLKTINVNKSCISYLSFSYNSNFLLISTTDNKIRVWDIKNSKFSKIYEGHKNKKAFLYPNSFFAHKKKQYVKFF